MAEDRYEAAFITGALLGSVAGAVYGLLNAPQAGWRTRADLSGAAEELGDRLAARVSSLTMWPRTPPDSELSSDVGEQWATSFGDTGTDAGTDIGTDTGAGSRPAERVADRTARVAANE